METNEFQMIKNEDTRLSRLQFWASLSSTGTILS